jgi:hypothetical protein
MLVGISLGISRAIPQSRGSKLMQGLKVASHNSTSPTGYYKNIKVFGLKPISPVIVCVLSEFSSQGDSPSPVVYNPKWTQFPSHGDISRPTDQSI